MAKDIKTVASIKMIVLPLPRRKAPDDFVAGPQVEPVAGKIALHW
jgi:hypothetical protein